MGLLAKMIDVEQLELVRSVIGDFRGLRAVYHYDYAPEDEAALKACGADTRPVSWALLSLGSAWWLTGRAQRALLPRAAAGLPARGAAAAVRAVLCVQAARAGFLAGSSVQAVDCAARLAALPTPLGGEICALLRERGGDGHPLLRHERAPAALDERGARPRIATEAARLEKLARLRAELDGAKHGSGAGGAPATAAAAPSPAPEAEAGGALLGDPLAMMGLGGSAAASAAAGPASGAAPPADLAEQRRRQRRRRRRYHEAHE